MYQNFLAKFSRIAILKLLQTHHTCNILWAWHTSLSGTHLTVTFVCSSLKLSAKQCLLPRYLFGESSFWIWQLGPGCCPLMLLQSECENCCVSKFLWKYFHKRLKICEILKIKDARKFSAILYILYVLVHTSFTNQTQ